MGLHFLSTTYTKSRWAEIWICFEILLRYLNSRSTTSTDASLSVCKFHLGTEIPLPAHYYTISFKNEWFLKEKVYTALRFRNAFYSGLNENLFSSNLTVTFLALWSKSVLSFPLPSGDSGFEPSQINYAMHLESRKKVLIKLNIVSQSS